MQKRVMLTLLVVLLLTNATDAVAQGLRVVILPKFIVDDRVRSDDSLDVEAFQILKQKQLRIVELTTALLAQKAALSDSVQKGLVPRELSVLNADALLSVQLSCSKSADAVVSSQFKAYYCVLSSKVIRVDSGDVVFAESKSWTGHGLNAAMAVQQVLQKKVPGAIDAGASKWTASFGGGQSWSLDLLVTGLKDRSQARKLATALSALPGVTSARQVVFKQQLAKYALSGSGPDNLRQIADQIEKSPKLALRVTYETQAVLHAQFDFGKAYGRPIILGLVTPGAGQAKSTGALLATMGTDLLRSALLNLGYFDVKQAERFVGGPKESRAAMSRLAAKAARARVPLVLLSTVARQGEQWSNSLTLASATGKPIAAATARAPDPLDAMDQAVRALDQKFRLALRQPGTQRLLGLPRQVADDAAPGGLLVESFKVGQLYPTRLASYQKAGVGSLRVRNASPRSVVGARVEYTMGGAVLSGEKVPELKPGRTVTLPVRINTFEAAAEQTRHTQMSAAVIYPAGETYRKTRAYAPVVLHASNTMDWSKPESLASFVDPNQQTVRGLATRAIGAQKPGGFLAPQLRDAAMIHAALWHQPLQYVADPVNTSFTSSIDTVQFPQQSLARGAGDCDDLTVLMASLFESVGIGTVVIVTPGHVLLGVDSGTLAGGHLLYNLPRSLFVPVDGGLFVPIEATAIGVDFFKAWQKGARAVNEARGNLYVFRTRQAWKAHAPAIGKAAGSVRLQVVQPPAERLSQGLAAMEKAEGGKSPAWAMALRQYAMGTEPDWATQLEPKELAQYQLAGPALTWLRGERAAGFQQMGKLCTQRMPEACYNWAVMLLDDKPRGLTAEELRQTYEDAVGLLPEPVLTMLIDRGSVGMGDEASKAAATRKRLAEVLRKARARLKEKGFKKKRPTVLSIKPVGGRKGKPDIGVREAALMFFWAPIGR